MLVHQWVENIQAMEGEIEKDGVEVSPGVGMITLPGGAVLVAKTGEGESSKDRLTRVARCSFNTLSLPVAPVPTLLAVYRDVRDTYKMLVQQGYVVGWAKLLTFRLKTS